MACQNPGLDLEGKKGHPPSSDNKLSPHAYTVVYFCYFTCHYLTTVTLPTSFAFIGLATELASYEVMMTHAVVYKSFKTTKIKVLH